MSQRALFYLCLFAVVCLCLAAGGQTIPPPDPDSASGLPASSLPATTLPDAPPPMLKYHPYVPHGIPVIDRLPYPVDGVSEIRPRSGISGSNEFYVPLSFAGKLRYAVASVATPRTLTEAGFISGFPYIPSAPGQPQAPNTMNAQTGEAYAQAMQNYGDRMDWWRRTSEAELRYTGSRYSFGLAVSATRVGLSDLVLPTLLHQDPRYLPATLDHPLSFRLGNAIGAVAFAQDNKGDWRPNFSKLAGTAGAAFIARYVYAESFPRPEYERNAFMGKYVAYSLAGDAATNVARELVRAADRQHLIDAYEDGPSTEQSYKPLNFGGKFVNWVRSTYSPRVFLEGLRSSGIPQIASEPKEPVSPNITNQQQEMAFDLQLASYGANLQSWRDGLESDLRFHERAAIGGMAEAETESFLSNLVLPVALHMDPRYIAEGPTAPAGKRLRHVFTSLIIAKADNGHDRLNVPLILGTVGSALAAKYEYYPALGVERFSNNCVVTCTVSFNVTVDLVSNLVHEIAAR